MEVSFFPCFSLLLDSDPNQFSEATNCQSHGLLPIVVLPRVKYDLIGQSDLAVHGEGALNSSARPEK